MGDLSNIRMEKSSTRIKFPIHVNLAYSYLRLLPFVRELNSTYVSLDERPWYGEQIQ